MVREQGPGVNCEGARLGQGGQAANEVRLIRRVAEADCPLNPAHHDVVQAGGRRFRTKYGRASRRARRGMVPSICHKTTRTARSPKFFCYLCSTRNLIAFLWAPSGVGNGSPGTNSFS